MNFITGNKFKKICDYILDEKGFYKTNVENKIPIFFVKTDYLEMFFSKYSPKTPFKIISHNSDHHITYHYEQFINDPNLVYWWGQNIDFVHPKLKSIPIGIANEIWPHGNENLFKDRIDNLPEKNRLFYVNFNIETNRKDREYCLKIMNEKKIEISQRTSFHNYLKELSSSFFCISPNGNGVDCHKTWESLYFKTIPILTDSINVKYYQDYPVFIIKNWDSFDPTFFNEKLYYEIIKKYDSYKLNIDYYYYNLIQEYD